LQRLSHFGEGVFTVSFLAEVLGRHGRLHGKLAMARLIYVFPSILSVSVWSGRVLAGAKTLPLLVIPLAWNATTRATAF